MKNGDLKLQSLLLSHLEARLAKVEPSWLRKKLESNIKEYSGDFWLVHDLILNIRHEIDPEDRDYIISKAGNRVCVNTIERAKEYIDQMIDGEIYKHYVHENEIMGVGEIM